MPEGEILRRRREVESPNFERRKMKGGGIINNQTVTESRWER